MRIGLNLLYLLPGIVGGTESYARGLISGLTEIDQHNEYLVFLNRESANWHFRAGQNFRTIVCPVSASSRVNRYFVEQTLFPFICRRHRVHLIHSLGYVAPLFPQCFSVVTIHDLNYRAYGSQMPFLKRAALHGFVTASVYRADHIIAVSQFTRKEILRAFRLLPCKISVTHEASTREADTHPDVQGVMPAFGISRPYILAFSSRSPNKNIGRLLKAYEIMRKRGGPQYDLVLVGHPPSGVNALTQKCRERVIFTGYVDEGIKRTLLKNAEMLVFPSMYEGFGLPVIEAMAAGVPVACSNVASLPEIAGPAAVFFDPFSVEGIADKMELLAMNLDLREELQRRGLQNASRFTWENTARGTVSVYSAVISSGRCKDEHR